MDPAQANQDLKDYVNRLIEEKGFLDLTPEVRAEVENDLLTQLDDFIVARTIAALSDEDVLSFENLLKDQKSDQEIQQFVADKIPDYPNFLAQVLLEFRDVYLGLTQAPPAEDQPA